MSRRRTLAGVARVAAVTCALVAVVVGVIVLWPVLSPGTHHAAGAATEPQVQVPVNALGGLGVSGILGTSLLFGLRGRRRAPGDP